MTKALTTAARAVLAAGFLTTGSVAFAADTDAVMAINTALASIRDYRLPNVCRDVEEQDEVWKPSHHFSHNIDIPDDGYYVTVTRRTTVCDVQRTGKLAVTNIGITAIAFDKQELIPNALPSKTIGRRFIGLNCSARDQQASLNFTWSNRTATRLVTTRGISNTISISTEASFSIYGSGGKVAVGDSYTVSQSSTNDIVHEQVTTENPVLTATEPAMARFFGDGFYTETTSRLKWHADVIVDGPVAPNQEGITLVSQVLSLADRTIPMDGYIDNVATSTLNQNFYSEPIDQAACAEHFAQRLPSLTHEDYVVGGAALPTQ